jgi:hypothetical protein
MLIFVKEINDPRTELILACVATGVRPDSKIHKNHKLIFI